MSDKVLIKQEIEKKRQLIWPTNTGEMKVVDTPNQLIQGWLNCLKWIEDFIDSLPEELGCEVNFTTKSEDLEEEIDRFEDWLNNFNQSDYPTSYTVRDIANHFAEWQKQQMKETLQTEYEKGRFDMREEMMKALIGGEVVKDMHNQLSVKSEPLNNTFGDIKFGEKVKIIIVKPE